MTGTEEWSTEEATPAGAALDHAPTATGLAVYRRRAVATLGGATLAVVATVAAAALGAPEGLWVRLAGVPLGLLVVAIWIAMRTRRMGQVLRDGPWVARLGHYRVAGGGRYSFPNLVLEAEAGRPEAVCSVMALRWTMDDLPEGTNVVWVAGDPVAYAVVAPPGGADLVPAKVPRWGWWRGRLRRWSAAPDAKDGP